VVSQDLLDQQALLVLKDLPGNLGCQAFKVQRDRLDQQDLLVLRVVKDQLGLQEHLVHQERKVVLDFQE